LTLTLNHEPRTSAAAESNGRFNGIGMTLINY